jgi:transposase
MQVTTLGIDLAKNVFCLHGCDANGKAVLRKQLSRRQLLSFVANLPRCLVAMEACAKLALLGARDPEARPPSATDRAKVCEALRQSQQETKPATPRLSARPRAGRRCVSSAQQDIQAIHRVRQQLVKTRTAWSIRCADYWTEHGIVIARGFAQLRRALPVILEDRDNGLSAVMRELVGESSERLRFIDERLRK